MKYNYINVFDAGVPMVYLLGSIKKFSDGVRMYVKYEDIVDLPVHRQRGLATLEHAEPIDNDEFIAYAYKTGHLKVIRSII